jgi:hypothetical protein
MLGTNRNKNLGIIMFSNIIRAKKQIGFRERERGRERGKQRERESEPGS